MTGVNRGAGANLPAAGDRLGLPVRPFLYSIDQVAALIGVEEKTVKISYLYYEGRSTGQPGRHYMIARNIAPPNFPPEWRVAERELIRWLKTKGFRIYETGVITR